ncbi:MAG TPA: hypothetical protein VM386_00700 [Acidimicrobiales bacterium]|nr:hypothetical protein [Acidimicrobiales bacterium]
MTSAHDQLNSIIGSAGVLVGTVETSCSTQNGELVDVLWEGSTAPGGDALNLGSFRCINLGRDAQHCDRGQIFLNTNLLVLPVALRPKAACHELGHSFGAHHSAGDHCMSTSSNPAASYAVHEVEHFRAWAAANPAPHPRVK